MFWTCLLWKTKRDQLLPVSFGLLRRLDLQKEVLEATGIP